MIEKTILSNLIYNEEYTRKVLPFLKDEYFAGEDKIVFGAIEEFVAKYNNLPTKEALYIETDNLTGISDTQLSEIKKTISGLTTDNTDLEWLVENTEKFCQDKAIYNAVMESILILDNKQDEKEKKDKGAIPNILSDALAVSFDSHIGHDLFEDIDVRYDFYHKTESRIAFDIELLNRITNGGLPNKTLNIILAGTNVGKSLAMCHMATHNLLDGKNVLYITMEMAEERIAERIDANIMNVNLDDIESLPKEVYENKLNQIKQKTTGKLIIKEYPTASAGVGHFRHLLNELKLKKGFIPDIIYIDYLNICISSRIRFGGNVNSYGYIKAIAEELRGLAVEANLPIISATQTNREGFNSSDVDLTNTSESFGLPATADFMIAMISTDELSDMDQIMIKQLKNRYYDVNKTRRFTVGIDRAKMRLYNVDQQEVNTDIKEKDDDIPLFDKSDFGRKMMARGDGPKNFNDLKF